MKESKAKVTSIKATSRTAIKIRDNYYTIEYTEERSIPDTDVDIEFERSALWDDVCRTVDNQCAEIINTFNSKR